MWRLPKSKSFIGDWEDYSYGYDDADYIKSFKLISPAVVEFLLYKLEIKPESLGSYST